MTEETRTYYHPRGGTVGGDGVTVRTAYGSQAGAPLLQITGTPEALQKMERQYRLQRVILPGNGLHGRVNT